MSNQGTELYLEHVKSQAQFAYFVLGVSASAIAFAIHETKDQALRDTPWPVGLAVALWAISFLLGCLGLSSRQRAIAVNANYLFAADRSGQHINHPEIAPLVQEAEAFVAKRVSAPPRLFDWQRLTLFFGAVAFIAGHVMHMAGLPLTMPAAKVEDNTVSVAR